jgi:hypothetical protein
MKKLQYLGLLVILLTFGISISGCSSVSTKYQNPDISWQEQALILLPMITEPGLIDIFGLDGNNSSTYTVQSGQVGVIPSGRHTIKFMIKRYDEKSKTHYSLKFPGADITADFESGGRYVLYGTINSSLEVFSEIMTIDEYRTWFMNNVPKTTYSYYGDSEMQFQKLVLDKFVAAEAELNKKQKKR